jgi:hypothetical protein
MSATDYDRTMQKRAEAVARFKIELRAALREVLSDADAEFMAEAMVSEHSAMTFRQVAEELVGRKDSDAIIRRVFWDVIDRWIKRSQSGCLSGRSYAIECALKTRLGL